MWKTSNGGQSWQPLGDFLATMHWLWMRSHRPLLACSMPERGKDTDKSFLSNTGLAKHKIRKKQKKSCQKRSISIGYGQLPVMTLQIFQPKRPCSPPVAPPQIAEIAPRKAKPGKLVTITGNNFENGVVFFGQLRVSLVTASATRLQFLVPQTPRGDVIIAITTPGGRAQINFRVK